MNLTWMEDARRNLLELRRGAGAWGYAARTLPAAEPTALAGLAMTEVAPETARSAGHWLAAIRCRSGSLDLTEGLAGPCWSIPFAYLLWSAMGEHRSEQSSVIDWLLKTKGESSPHFKNHPAGHDTTLIGWPWVAGTHSWVEPTAMALLALGREGKLGHPRAVEGFAVLRDRAIPTGGWNLGNPVVFGTVLRPLPGPTGLALLALAQTGAASEQVVGPAIAYLLSALPRTHAPASLAWGLLGLKAWGHDVSAFNDQLAETYHLMTRKPSAPLALALLLLAADDHAPGMFGITPRSGDGSRSQ